MYLLGFFGVAESRFMLVLAALLYTKMRQKQSDCGEMGASGKEEGVNRELLRRSR